jgi:hypothetical protein
VIFQVRLFTPPPSSRHLDPFKFQPHFEVCNTFNVKYVPPHRRFIKEEPKKKEESEKKKVKEIKEVVASVKTKEQSQPMETKK